MSTAEPPSVPGYPVDALADLHAGVYPDDVAATMRARIADDTAAQQVLQALDRTVDELSLLPPIAMPPEVAARLDRAIAAAAAGPAVLLPGPIDQPRPGSPTSPTRPVIPPALPIPPGGGPGRRAVVGSEYVPTYAPAPAHSAIPTGPTLPPPTPAPVTALSERRARSRRRGWITGAALVAAAAVGAVVVIVTTRPAGTPIAGTPGPGATITAQPTNRGGAIQALTVEPGHLGQAYDEVKGRNTGTLANPIAAASCFAANHIGAADLLGVRDVTYQGKAAVAIAVATTPGKATILIVGLTCGSGGPDVLAQQTVDR